MTSLARLPFSSALFTHVTTLSLPGILWSDSKHCPVAGSECTAEFREFTHLDESFFVAAITELVGYDGKIAEPKYCGDTQGVKNRLR